MAVPFVLRNSFTLVEITESTLPRRITILLMFAAEIGCRDLYCGVPRLQPHQRWRKNPKKFGLHQLATLVAWSGNLGIPLMNHNQK